MLHTCVRILALLTALLVSASASAQISAADFQAIFSQIAAEHAEDFRQRLNDESERQGVQRPLLVEPADDDVLATDIALAFPLVDLARGKVIGWALRYNIAGLIALKSSRMLYLSRTAVCQKKHGYLDTEHPSMGKDDHRAIHRCVYHRFVEEGQTNDYVSLSREDQASVLEHIATREPNEEVAAFLRRFYGDPPLTHWTGR